MPIDIYECSTVSFERLFEERKQACSLEKLHPRVPVVESSIVLYVLVSNVTVLLSITIRYARQQSDIQRAWDKQSLASKTYFFCSYFFDACGYLLRRRPLLGRRRSPLLYLF